ncbi:MAG: dihydrodipicolinate synthase family protein [Candidatus Hadarchaeum sp.]|uniref:dihydrodipicolinate synthase family protein n=1 Tax=Candidatus Hadarchaeum sp. TaxID=2883567 RepID=UPI0031823C5C
MLQLIKGVIPPMITVFQKDETIDERRTRDHVNFLIKNGVHAIAPGGSTGEFIALDIEERKRLIELVIDEVNGRVPVYPGTAHYSTRRTIELSKFAERVGAQGVMVIPPYYLNPPKHDAINHFRALREAINIPIILYNNVWFAGYEFTPWEIAQLVEEGVLQGVKEAHGDPWKVHTLKHLCGDKLMVYYGHDVNGLEALLCGADGWLTGMVNLIPAACVQLYKLSQQGFLDEARALWNKLIPLVNFICVNRKDNYPHFVQIFKDGLNLLGQDVGKPLKPLTPLKEEQKAYLASILKELVHEGVIKI